MTITKFTGGTFVTAFRNPIGRGNRCPFHSHDCVEIVFHAKGSGTTSLLNGEAYAYPERSAVIYAAGVVHNQSTTHGEAGTDLCFLLKIKRKEWPFAREIAVIPEIRHGYLLRELQECDTWFSDDRSAWAPMLDMRISALFAGLVMASAQSRRANLSSPTERHAEEAKKRIEADIGKARNVGDVARKLGLSPDHLRHVFKARYGTTLTCFILAARIGRAKELLGYSSLSLKEIAPACGFANERQMCVTFKAALGVSPGRYRLAAGNRAGSAGAN